MQLAPWDIWRLVLWGLLPAHTDGARRLRGGHGSDRDRDGDGDGPGEVDPIILGCVVIVVLLVVGACVCYNCAGCYWFNRRVEAEREELDRERTMELQTIQQFSFALELNSMCRCENHSLPGYSQDGPMPPPVYSVSDANPAEPESAESDPVSEQDASAVDAVEEGVAQHQATDSVPKLTVIASHELGCEEVPADIAAEDHGDQVARV